MRQKVSSYEEKKRFILYKGHTGWKIKTRIFGSLLITFSAFAFAENTGIISVHAADATPQQEENVAAPTKDNSSVSSETTTQSKPDVGTNTASVSDNTYKKVVSSNVESTVSDDNGRQQSASVVPENVNKDTALNEAQLQSSGTELKDKSIVDQTAGANEKTDTNVQTQVGNILTKQSLLRSTVGDAQSVDDSAVDTTAIDKEYPVLSQDSSTDIGNDTTEVNLTAEQIKNHFTATVENKGSQDQDDDPTDNTKAIPIASDGSIDLTTNDMHRYYSSPYNYDDTMHGHQVAHVSFEHEIDFSNNFDMTGALGIGSRSGSNAADSVGFVFAPGNPATATKGGSGGQLGIGGLQNAFGFVYDQYYNSDQNDPSSSPYFGWRTTDAYGNLQPVTSTSEWANATSDNLPSLNDRNTNPLNKFTMHYDAESKVLRVTLGGKNFYRNITDTSTGYSISVAASTGGSWNDYSAKIDSFSYTPKTIDLGVDLVDSVDKDSLFKDGATVKAVANIGDTISVFSTQEAANRAVKAGEVKPSLVTVIPKDKNGNIYVIDGNKIVSNNNGQAHYINGTNDGIVGNTYYSYTVTDGTNQSMTVPVKMAFTAKVTPVDKSTGDPISGLKPVTVVAVEGEKTLVQVPGYTSTAIVLNTPKDGQTVADDTLPIDMSTTKTDGTQTKDVSNPIDHYYTGTGKTIDGQAVDSTATVGTGQSISTALDNQKFTVNSGGKTPITSSDYYWSDVGNATSTDSTDADAAQTSSSLLVPTNSTLQYWEGQAATNETTAKDYQKQANDIYTQFTAIANLTSGQQTDAKNLLDEINTFYKNVSATNDSAKAAFANGQTSTVANDIYDYGQTGYAYLKKVENLLADFKTDLTSYDKENKDAHSSLATFSSYKLTYGDEIIPPKDFSVGDGFGPVTAAQKATMNNPDYYQYYNLDGSGGAIIPKNVGQYIVKLTEAGRTQLKSLSTDPDKAGLYVSPVLTIEPKSISNVNVQPTSVDYGGLDGNFPTFSTDLDSDKLYQSDYTVVDNSTNKTITNAQDLRAGGDYSISLNEKGKESLAGKMDSDNTQIGGDPNYSIGGFTSGKLTVNPKEITISAQTNGKVYGENDPELGLTADSANGLVNGDSLSNLGIVLTRTDKNSDNVGEYQIIVDETKSTSNPNYKITFNPASFNISPKNITVSVNKPDTITYGQKPTLSISAVDRDGNPIDVSAAKLDLADFSVKDQDVNLSQTILDANTAEGYTIELNDSGKNKLTNNCPNYVADDKIGTNILKVNKAPVNLDITGPDIIYGDTLNFKVSSKENVDLKGLSSLETSDFTENGNDIPVDFQTLNVGSHDLGLTKTAVEKLQDDNSNYYVKSVSGALTVKAKPVTVAVKVNGNTETSSVYGNSPKLQVIVSDENGDLVTLKDTDLTADDFTIIGKDATDFDTLSVGDGYEIGLTATALSNLKSNNPNYAIAFTNGKLTITPAKATVKISSSSKYGMMPEFKITADAGVNPPVNVDNIKLDSKYFMAVKEPTTAFNDLDVGDYDVELTEDGLKALNVARPNYDFVSSSGKLSIGKVDVTVKITANDNNESVYGTTPIFTVSDIGNHKGLSDLNTLKLDDGDFVVENQTSTKFETLDASEAGADYEIRLNQKGLDALNAAKTNYNFISSLGNLTITQEPVKVQIDMGKNTSFEYGTNPTFNLIVTNDKDEKVSLNGSDLNLSNYTVVGQDKTDFSKLDFDNNDYEVVLTADTLDNLIKDNPNYDLTQLSLKSVKVNKATANVQITANENNESIYGMNPKFTIVATDDQGNKIALNDVQLNSNDFTVKNQPNTDFSQLDVNNYELLLTKDGYQKLNDANHNYDFTASSGTLKVNKLPVKVQIGMNSKDTSYVYGTNPEFNIIATDNDNQGVTLNGSSLSRDDFTIDGNDETNFASLPVNNKGYEVVLTSEALSNLVNENKDFDISLTPLQRVQVTRSPATVQIIAGNNNSSVYGTEPSFIVKAFDKDNNTINLNEIKLDNSDFTVKNQQTIDFSTLHVDNYDIELTNNGLQKLNEANTNYSFTSSDGTLNITKAPATAQIVINKDNKSIYGTKPELALNATVNNSTKTIDLSGVPLNDDDFKIIGKESNDISKLNVGSYTIQLTQTGLRDLNNLKTDYNFGSLSANLEVTEAPATIQITVNRDTNKNNSNTYGTNPKFTLSATTKDTNEPINLNGINLNDNEFVVSDQKQTDFSKLKVGTYSIKLTDKGLQDLNNIMPNYSFDGSNGNITINSAPVRLRIINTKNIEYSKHITQKDINAGVSAGTRTSDLTGIPTADDYQIIDDSTHKPVLSLADLKVGSYTIQLKPESLSNWQSENQNFTLIQTDLGKFTINPETVKLNITTKPITYGETPSFNETTSGDENVGLKNQPTNDDYEIVDANGDIVSAENLNRLQAGEYTVRLKAASRAKMAAENPNYTFDNDSTGISGIPLIVKKRRVTINVTPQTKYTDEKNPTNSSTVTSGVINKGDSLNLAYAEPTSSDVGTYIINAESGNANYDVTVVPGKLVVLGKTTDKEGNTTTTQKDEHGKVVDVNKSWNDGTKTNYQYDPKTGAQTFTESLNGKPVIKKTVQAVPEKLYLPDGNGAITVITVKSDDPETPAIVHYGIDPDKDGRTSADEIMKYHTDPLVYNSRGGHSQLINDATVVQKNQNVSTTTFTVALYNKEGKQINDRLLGIDSCWFSDEEYTIGGVMYYRVATDEFAKASDVYVYVDPEPRFVRVYNDIHGDLVDYQGNELNRELSPSSQWRTDRIAIINGQQYYRVATNEFIPVEQVYPYVNVDAEVTTNFETPIYNERDEKLDIALPANGTYKADKVVTMNGVNYYRVATNQFIPIAAVRNYASVSLNVTTNINTPIYNEQGQFMNVELPAKATYKVDRIVYINGVHYYRVATNMFIRVKGF